MFLYKSKNSGAGDWTKKYSKNIAVSRCRVVAKINLYRCEIFKQYLKLLLPAFIHNLHTKEVMEEAK